MSHLGHDCPPISMPLQRYAQLAADFTSRINALQEAEYPEANEIKGRIRTICEEAQRRNLRVDDETVARDPEAARLREALDADMPRFEDLAQRCLRRKTMTSYFLKRVEEGFRTGSVAVPAIELNLLLGLDGDTISDAVLKLAA